LLPSSRRASAAPLLADPKAPRRTLRRIEELRTSTDEASVEQLAKEAAKLYMAARVHWRELCRLPKNEILQY